MPETTVGDDARPTSARSNSSFSSQVHDPSFYMTTDTSRPPPETLAPPGGPPKKRARNNSTVTERRESFAAAKSSSPNGDKKDPHSILVREKKQKACANCRRAKLKCIVEENESDCVRCRARKERCIFYPRGHDEDWQQTLTADVYNGLQHLSHMSAAVHHILEHLTRQGAVPPMEHPFQRYEVPERELAVLQGWGAERNRELAAEANRKRRRSKKSEDDMDDSALSMAPFPPDYKMMDVPHGQGIRPSDVHMQRLERINSSPDAMTFPPGQGPSNYGPMGPVEMGGFRPNGPNGAHGPNGPNGPSGPPGMHPTPTSLPAISPVETTHCSASSVDSSQPGPVSGPMAPPSNPSGSTQGIFGLLNESRPAQSPSSQAPPNPASFASEQLGAADPRPNIIKRGLIGNGEAISLVNYFHSKLSPWLFGYRLEFCKFPYIPQGPSTITPFILSVMCLVAAERVPKSHEHRPVLAREVTQLLVNSPADSFISTLDTPFGGGSGAKDEDGEEELDPELGIGPEEIIGACILATFMTEREQAATIASSAFKWARGWIKWTSLTVPLPPTLGEVCGLLPVKRDATREDMARVWLLCYIVDGTEALQRDNPATPRRDPMAYCQVLIPDSPLPGEAYPPHDILLTFHARLITLLRDWYHRRSQHEAAMQGVNPAAQSAAHARLASSINASLEWWRADLESHGLGPDWMRHIDLFWEFARMLVHATSAKSLGGNPRLRSASWAHGIEAAVGFLEKCHAWPSREELCNLPPCYLSMITLAGSVLVDAIKDQGLSGSPFQAEDAIPLLNDVADMLSSGGLPQAHVSRNAGQTLRQYADQLARVSSA